MSFASRMASAAVGVILALALIAVSAAVAEPTAAPGTPGSGVTNGGTAVATLGDRLPLVAKAYGFSTERLRELLLTDLTLHIDESDKLLYVEPARAAATPPRSTSAQPAEQPQALPAPLADTFLLHSRPGSHRVVYLDFDGHYLSGTAWNFEFTNNQPVNCPPWNIDGNPSVFGDVERTRIQQAWQRVAEDYAPFDVDVTTEYPGEAALVRSSAQDQDFGMRVLVSPISASIAPSSGGIAYVGVFDLWGYGDYYQPALVFPENLSNGEKYIGEAATHEAGHTLWLHHDGLAGGDNYYWGHGTGETGWAPIMGAGYDRNLTQWSKGEYSSASNTEDDLALMLLHGLSYRPDDVGDDAASASPLPAGPAPQVSGLIGVTGDADTFSVRSGPGTLTAAATVTSLGPNLDVLLELRDAAGSLLASSNPADLLGASLSAPVATGTYYLTVRGTGKPTPPASGYTAYASLGAYTVDAAVPPIPTYTLTPSAGANGSISPATPQVVEEGTDLTFTVTPAAGYHVLDVRVDGVSVGPTRSYRFAGVTADHTIQALFAADAPSAADSVLVFVAHPDDEALTAAGVLETALAAGAPTKVVLVTNGDHQGMASGLARQLESVTALALLGLPESDVVFLGYPGISAGGALRTIYNNYPDPAGATYVSPATGRSTTYGNRGLGGRDFHSYRTGETGLYRRDQLLSDIEDVLRRYRPTKIFTHSSADEHSDHRVVYRYLVDALAAVEADDPTIRPDVYSATIHNPTYYPYTDLWAPTDFSSGLPSNFWKNGLWPLPMETGTDYAHQILRFTATSALTAPLDLPQTAYPWAARVSLPVPADMQIDARDATNKKFALIDAYVSQRVSFNYAFGKSDEVFWRHPWSRNIALAATVTASSANQAGFQLPRSAVDGVVDGAPADAQAEWAAAGTAGVGQSLTLTWPRTYRIASVRLFDRPRVGTQVTSAQLAFGDGTVLTVGPLPDDALTPLEVIPPAPVDASSLTITVTGFTDAAGGNAAGLAEVEVYGDPVGATATRSPVFVSGPGADGGRYYTEPGGELALSALARDPDGGAVTYSWEAAYGTFVGSGAHVTYRAPASGEARDLITVRAGDGVDPATAAVMAVDVLNGVPNGLPVLQDAGADGLVAVEAEFYDATVPGGDPSWPAGIHAWAPDLTEGASGVGALTASPNSGNQVTLAPLESRSPRLDYQVRFLSSGTHYVWIRGLGPTAGDDSVHVGLNGVIPASSDHIEGFTSAWGWSRATVGNGPVATLQIPTPGVYTVNVFMREDGFKLDKLLLTTNASYVPTGLGPASNPRRLPQASTPTITPPGGAFTGSVEVTLASTTPGAVIHYTLDGSTPSVGSPVYGGPFTLTASATVKALAEATGYQVSGVAAAGFAVTLPTPQPTVTNPNAGGTFTQGSVVPVTWTIPGPAPGGTFIVYLYNQSAGALHLLTTQAAGAATSYSYDWTVTQPPAAGYRIYIWYRDTVGNWLYYDLSDQVFTIG